MNAELKGELFEFGKLAAITIGLFILGLAFGADIPQALMVACVPFGWSALNMITPGIFLWMSWIGWVIYLILKIALSAVVGVFVLAYKFAKCILRIIVAYKAA